MAFMPFLESLNDVLRSLSVCYAAAGTWNYHSRTYSAEVKN